MCKHHFVRLIAVSLAGFAAAACISVRTGQPAAKSTETSAASEGRPPPTPPPQGPPKPERPEASDHPEFDRSENDLAGAISKQTAGMAKAGPENRGRLEAFKPIGFRAARGVCYVATLRLGKGASFSEQARKGGVDFAFLLNGQNEGGGGAIGPGGLGEFCPLKSGAVKFDLRALWGSRGDDSAVHDLGQGDYTIQIYTKARPAADLAKEEADRHKAEEAADEAVRHREAQACSDCRKERAQCVEGTGTRPHAGQTCQDVFDWCMQRHASTPKSCP